MNLTRPGTVRDDVVQADRDAPMTHPPVTAIVIFRNEKHHLERCLSALRWCGEVIAVDMESSDGSLEIAKEWADRVLSVAQCPIAKLC